MKEFKKFGKPQGGFDRNRGDRPRFGGKASFNKFGDRGGKRDDKEMFQATCAQCGKICEVPFKPNGKKPVYCTDCFDKDRNQANASPFDKGSFKPRQERSFDRSERSFAPRESSFNKPSFDAKPDRRIDDLQNQVNQLHTKLDQVLSMLKTAPVTTASVKPETVAVKSEKTAKKPAKKEAAKKAPTKAAKKVSKKK